MWWSSRQVSGSSRKRRIHPDLDPGIISLIRSWQKFEGRAPSLRRWPRSSTNERVLSPFALLREDICSNGFPRPLMPIWHCHSHATNRADFGLGFKVPLACTPSVAICNHQERAVIPGEDGGSVDTGEIYITIETYVFVKYLSLRVVDPGVRSVSVVESFLVLGRTLYHPGAMCPRWVCEGEGGVDNDIFVLSVFFPWGGLSYLGTFILKAAHTQEEAGRPYSLRRPFMATLRALL